MRKKRYRHPSTDRQKTTGIRSPLLQYGLIAVLILIGVICGAKIAGTSGIAQENSFGLFMQEMLSKTAAAKGFWSLFLSSFFASALLLLAAFALGLCAVGSIGHVALAVFKGAGIGLSMGYVYIEYGMKGLAICALFILPWAIMTSLAVMVACREGIGFSFLVARAVLPTGGTPHPWDLFGNYCYKFLSCFILVLIAAVVEALSTLAFSMLFFS